MSVRSMSKGVLIMRKRSAAADMARSNPLHRLEQLGQSVWLDYIDRGFIDGGGLANVIDEDGVSGLTSNPAIFHKAITEHPEYERAIAALARDGLAAHEIYEALIIEDIRKSADALAGIHERTNGHDGFVSLEIAPNFARDAEGTYWEAKRLWALVDRRNLMIKVPGTAETVSVIQRLTADAVNVNVTLLFSVERYDLVADAFIAGLEQRVALNQSVAGIASVASFFLSRIDTLVDQLLESSGAAGARTLQGRCALASARRAYEHFRVRTGAPRWRSLSSRGVRPQRLLWASTGTKNPAYSDVKYVDALIGPDTITTLPVETLMAYRDHGDPALRLQEEGTDNEVYAGELTRQLAAAGVDLDTVVQQLEEEGIRKFVEPFEATLAELRTRLDAVKTEH
jgi:transaldolase